MASRIAITGATGYVGCSAIEGTEVYGLSRSEPGDAKLRTLDATPVRGDLGSFDIIKQNSADADMVVHLADAFASDFSMEYGKGLCVSNLIPDGAETTETAPLHIDIPVKRYFSEQNALALNQKGIRTCAVLLAPLFYGWRAPGVRLFMGIFLPLLAVAHRCCVNFAIGNLGWDRHIWESSLDELAESLWFSIISKLLFIAAGTCVRMALLLFCFWLVKDYTNSPMRRVCLIANGVLCVIVILFSIFGCAPVSAAWTFPRSAGGKCSDEGIVVTVTGAFLTLADLIVNVLPLPIVARLKVSRRERVEVTVLLSLGAIATIAGTFRTIRMHKVFRKSGDSTWNSLPLWDCAEVEIYTGMFCACLPSIEPLWIKSFNHFKAKTNHLESAEKESNPRNVNLLQCSQPQTS